MKAPQRESNEAGGAPPPTQGPGSGTPTAGDGQAAGGVSPDWLFKLDGQVYGPVSTERLLGLIAEETVGSATELAPGAAGFARADTFPTLLVHLEKAQVRARVHADARRHAARALRWQALRWVGLGAGGLVLVAVALTTAWFLAVKRPWLRHSELLADLGGGLTVSAAHVATSRRSDEEVTVPPAAESSRERPRRPQSPRAAGPGPGQPAVGELAPVVLAHYDQARIEQVVARHRASLAGCIREEAARSPELSGEIPIEFAVGNDGRLAALWIDEPRLRSGPLRECLLGQLRAWAFDSFAGERPVVSLSFRLETR